VRARAFGPRNGLHPMVDVMPIANKTANEPNAVKNHFPARPT
jgi:hypothetical protein